MYGTHNNKPEFFPPKGSNKPIFTTDSTLKGVTYAQEMQTNQEVKAEYKKGRWQYKEAKPKK